MSTYSCCRTDTYLLNFWLWLTPTAVLNARYIKLTCWSQVQTGKLDMLTWGNTAWCRHIQNIQLVESPSGYTACWVTSGWYNLLSCLSQTILLVRSLLGYAAFESLFGIAAWVTCGKYSCFRHIREILFLESHLGIPTACIKSCKFQVFHRKCHV